MEISFPPPIWKLPPFKKKVLVWSRDKGLRMEEREETIQFPPPMLTIEFKEEESTGS